MGGDAHEHMQRPTHEIIDETQLAQTMGVTGRTRALDEAPVSRLSEPQLDALALEQQQQRLLAKMFSVQSEPIRLGQYVVLGELGRGGMGIVYEAYDRKLDRKVAVKLLGPSSGGAAARMRFLREAQALAKLSHPNIVQVHEVGTHGQAVFIAMEFVEGRTLTDWGREGDEPRPWRELLDALLQAGRGLEAAHQAKLVHRDFKPDNAIVGADGRVRVLDFGLVRGAEALDEPEAASDDEFGATNDDANSSATMAAASLSPATRDGLAPHEGDKLLDAKLTAQGAVMGTPAYMAPEQHAGEVSGPLADQFAFCAAAFELFYGVRPFEGRSMAALAQAKREGRRVPRPSERGGVRLPRELGAVIERGLAPAPEDRWPDISALLAELERVGAPPRRTRPMAVASLVTALFAGGLAVALDDGPGDMCAVDASALEGVWDDEQRARLRAGFARVGDHAEGSAREVEASLDRWAAGWLDAQRQACVDTNIEGVRSQQALDQRTACLARQRSQAAGLVEVLVEADAELVHASGEILQRLPQVEACADDELVEQRFPLPSSSEARAAIERGFTRVEQAETLAFVGQYRADALIDELSAELERGELDYAPLALEIRALPGRRDLWRRQLDAAVPALLEVAREAEGLHLDDLVAELRVDLVATTVGTWARPEREAWLLADAEAALARLERVGDARAFVLLMARGHALRDDGDVHGALESYREAVEQARELGELGWAEESRSYVGQALAELGRFDEAALEFEAARAAYAAHWGEDSSRYANVEYNLGWFETYRGNITEAARHLDTARALYVDCLGPDSAYVASVDDARATLAMSRGDFDEAEALFESVIATRARASEQRVDELAGTHEALGAVRFYQGDYGASLAAYARAFELYERVYAPDHPTIGLLHSNIGESQLALGEHETAQVSFARAISVLEHAFGPEHPDLALPYKGRGQCWLALSRPAEAREDLSRALGLQGEAGAPIERADIELSLARAEAALGDDAAARQLAERALTRYRALDYAAGVEAAERWLREIH